MERFPDHWHAIVELCNESDDFRELCDHFAECQRVLIKLQGVSPPQQERVDEYETIVRELESEIRKALEATG